VAQGEVRWIVCGGRAFSDARTLSRVLTGLAAHYWARGWHPKIISGGAKGADSLAVLWASTRGIPFQVFYADWATHGKAAGPKRNQAMLDATDGSFRLVVAFPGGRGTADMVARAMRSNVPVGLVDDTGRVDW